MADFETLLANIQRQERRARLHSALLLGVSGALAIALVGGAYWRAAQVERQKVAAEAALHTARDDLKEAQGQIVSLKLDAARLTAELKASQERLGESTGLERYQFNLEFLDLKRVSMTAPQPGKILFKILTLKDRVHWNATGATLEQGMSSPSFAAEVLNELNLLSLAPPVSHSALYDAMQKVAEPKLGDVVAYDYGLTLFYFEAPEDRSGKMTPFVIGLTPQGVIALKPEFATPRAYYRVPKR